MSFFSDLDPVLQAFIGTTFTYLVTALGASLVYFFRSVNRQVLDLMLGFAAGVMIAASFWSLILPSIELCRALGYSIWIMPSIGFICGGLFIVFASILMDKYSFATITKDSPKLTTLKRSILLVLAVTIHNIPEGFAVGIAFGGAALGIEGLTLLGAISLAIGIGLQNFPEGAAVSLPLYREGFSKRKSFLYGQLSGVVEPIAGVIGAVAVLVLEVYYLHVYLCRQAL